VKFLPRILDGDRRCPREVLIGDDGIVGSPKFVRVFKEGPFRLQVFFGRLIDGRVLIVT